MRAAVLGAWLVALLILGNLARLPDLQGSGSWLSAYEHDNPISPLLSTGDGVAFALLAEDLTLSDPSRFRPVEDASYRAQRILPAALAWLLAAGSHWFIPFAMLAMAFLGSLWLAYEAGLVSRRVGRSALWGGLVVLLPGSVASLEWFGAENLGLALVLFGLRTGRVWAHAAAGLIRESLLLPSLLQARRDRKYLIPSIVFLAWAFIVRMRYGSWFFEAEAGERLGLLVSWWSYPLLLGFLLVRRPYGKYVAAYSGLGMVMGSAVWAHWSNATRPLMPLFILSAAALFARAKWDRPRSDAANPKTPPFELCSEGT